MKTIKNFSGWIDATILAGLILFGMFVGHLSGEPRIGLMTGIAAGLTGIAGFRYFVETISLRKVRESRIQLGDDLSSRKAA